MIAASSRSRPARSRQVGVTPRRGVALVFVLIFVVAMAALAMSSIFMAGNSTLLAKSYDKERSLKYAAEAALALGKSRVNSDPSALQLPVDSIFRVLLWQTVLKGADGQPLSGGVYVNVYVGPTGSTSGQSGRFSSIVAEARDGKGNGFIRRLELAQESFAKFAYWSNSETNNGTTIYFGDGDELWGPVWSNDNISISGSPRFHDLVATSGAIAPVKNTATFDKGFKEKQKKITLPATTVLDLLKGYAASGKFDFSASSNRGPSADENSVRDRLEFVAYDMGEKADSTDDYEGFVRRFTAKADVDLRGDFPGNTDSSKVKLCGDWHYSVPSATYATVDTGLKFYPVSVHNTAWFRTQMAAGITRKYPAQAGTAATTADAHSKKNVGIIMTTATEGVSARCYLAGDPHLVSVERDAAQGYSTLDIQKGGDDTTFTPVGKNGSWLQYTTSPDTQIVRMRSHPRGITNAGNATEAQYLFPLGRKYNNGAKGVIYEKGNVGVSGTVNGLVTLYAKGSVVFLDDVRYANDPATGRCHDILGIITDFDAVVAENALLEPVNVGKNAAGTVVTKNVDDTKDFYIHAVIMALGTSFRVENYSGGPTNVNDCDVTNNGRGCIYLSGGLIQASRGAVGLLDGHGYSKRYTYDRCAVVNPPPYFPTTGRFTDNRYIELDPQGFKPLDYFQSLDPNKAP
jgi:hypothetical protein